MNRAIRYPGGKGTCFHQIINLMPPHVIYIETHAGGGAVLRNKLPAQHSIAIEIDKAAYWKLRDLKLDNPYIELYNTDALDYLRSFQPDENTLIYADPPYLLSARKSGKRYRHEYTEADHIQLLKKLRSLWPTMVMISGYWSEMYMDMLHDWNRYDFNTMTRGGMAKEYLWYNYPTPTELHDYRYLGKTFRDRERITRKQKRWVANLIRMPELERNALLDHIQKGLKDEI